MSESDHVKSENSAKNAASNMVKYRLSFDILEGQLILTGVGVSKRLVVASRGALPTMTLFQAAAV